MFALTDGMHYYLCQHYVDMRKGMTGLYPACQVRHVPFSRFG